MSEKSKKKVFSVNDVAAMCQVSNETIRRWVRKQGLKAYNTSAGLAIKIVDKDLAEFAEKYNIYVDWD